jgi:hypothetical protein
MLYIELIKEKFEEFIVNILKLLVFFVLCFVFNSLSASVIDYRCEFYHNDSPNELISPRSRHSGADVRVNNKVTISDKYDKHDSNPIEHIRKKTLVANGTTFFVSFIPKPDSSEILGRVGLIRISNYDEAVFTESFCYGDSNCTAILSIDNTRVEGICDISAK